MLPTSINEAHHEELNQDTLPDSTPRKEGGGDAKGESKNVLANEELHRKNTNINLHQASTMVPDSKKQDHL